MTPRPAVAASLPGMRTLGAGDSGRCIDQGTEHFVSGFNHLGAGFRLILTLAQSDQAFRQIRARLLGRTRRGVNLISRRRRSWLRLRTQRIAGDIRRSLIDPALARLNGADARVEGAS